MLDINQKIHTALKTIKENDGFLGPVDDPVLRANLFRWATVEVSPLTGLDVQWTLTPAGKKKLREMNGYARWKKKNDEYRASGRGRRYQPYEREAPVPLTVDVLDALRSIRLNGDPNTTRLDILARIQRNGFHAAKTVKGAEGQEVLIAGSLAECKDGVWTLTDAGRRAEAGHIRKSECAQFSGKVR